MARRGRRGEGTVYWSESDRRWIARWPLGIVNGKRQDKRAKFRTRDEADAELKVMARIYGRAGADAGTPLGRYLAEWLPAHARRLRPSTAHSYESHIRLHIDPLLGGIPLNRLQVRDVRRLVAELERTKSARGKRANAKPLSAGTIHLVIRTLSAALAQAKADRLIADNPCEGVRLPRLDRDPVHAMTGADADAILAAVKGTWVERPVRVMLGSGLRRGEVLGLDQGDLLLTDGFVRVRHSKTTVRAVPVSEDAVEALREAVRKAPRIGPGEPVFWSPRVNREGQRVRMAGASLTHALPEILEAAGLGKLSPHALRHGAATLMLADGAPMRVIAEQLGHSNPSLTARVYAHVVPTAQRAAVASLNRRQTR